MLQISSCCALVGLITSTSEPTLKETQGSTGTGRVKLKNESFTAEEKYQHGDNEPKEDTNGKDEEV